MSDFAIRLRIHNEDGTKGRVLKTSNLEVSEGLNSAGAINFTTSERFGGALSAPFVVGVEYGSTTLAYTAPRNNLYIVFADDSDTTDISGTRTFSGMGYIPWLLSKLILETASTAKNGKRKWTDSYPARPLRAMINEGQARGWAPNLVMDWTATVDSVGSAWTSADDETQSFPLGITAWQVLESAVEDGLFDWWTEGMTLRIKRNPLGVNRTNTVKLGGRGFVSAPVKSDASEIITNLYITGDELKKPVRVLNEGATTRFGRLEGSMTVSGVEKEASAIRRAKPTLADAKNVKREMTYEWVPRREVRRPWVDFNVGDDVLAQVRGEAYQQLRVIRIQAKQSGDKMSATITVGQKIHSKATKTSRRASATSTSGAVRGSAIVVPSAGTVPSTEPLAPTALAALSNQGYFAADGTARARVDFGWNPVVLATDGTEITAAVYELHYKATDAAGWRSTRVIGNASTIDTLPSGVEHQAKVRAQSDAGVWSEFSTVLTFTPGTPTEVPNPPTAPVLRSELGTITATWDGLLSDGAPRPGWAGVVLEARKGTTGTWTVVGEMKRGGITFTAKKIGAALGETVQGRLIAVSTIGGQSAASPTASVTVGGIVGPDLEANSVTTNALASGAVKARHMAVGVDETGQRVEMTGAGMKVFNPDGDPVVSIGTSTDDLISVMQKTPEGDMVPVAQIDETGAGAFQQLTLSGEVDAQGTPLIGTLAADPMNGFDLGDVPMLDRFGRGLVAVAEVGASNYSGVTYTAATLAVGSVELLAHRVYQVRLVGPTAQSWITDGSSGNLLIQCFVGTGSQVLMSPNNTNGSASGCVVLRSSASIGTGVQELFTFRAFSPTVSGQFNIMIRLRNESNRAWAFTPNLVASNPTHVEVWDVGSAASFWETESWESRVTAGSAGGGTDVIPPPASKKTLEVNAIWSVLWGPSGSIRPSSGNLYDDGRMVQGGNTSFGNGRAGQIGFPALGLSGKEALGMWVLLKNRHTANSSAAVDIGTHGNGSAPSGSSPNNANTFSRTFQRGQKQWIAIPKSLWAGFMSGAYRGIQIGGPNVNSGKSDYAIFDGFSTTNAATSGNGVRPRLKVSYR